jgi:hypothetical protein
LREAFAASSLPDLLAEQAGFQAVSACLPAEVAALDSFGTGIT